MSKITVFDSPCSSGKTTKMIELIKSNPNSSYVYITPFLDEVARVKKEIPNFKEPKNFGNGKMDSLKKLMYSGHNIASTHALFKNCTPDIVDTIKVGHYNLILDEVMDVVEVLSMKRDDLPSILQLGLATVNSKTCRLEWQKDDYKGKYDDIMNLCKLRHVFVVDDKCLVYTFPIEIFSAFDNIYICTYMFDYQIQRYYYDLFGVKYTKVSVKDGDVVPYEFTKLNTDCIKVLEEHKVNAIGKGTFDLSKSWYIKHRKSLPYLKKNMYNYARQIAPKEVGHKLKSSDMLWTTFKDFKQSLAGKGYANAFLANNARATNKYITRTIIMYVINRYLSPYVVKYFSANNIKIDEDMYALSEMVQFIYRSAIREGHNIYCYIPSKRMRNLLLDYVNTK